MLQSSRRRDRIETASVTAIAFTGARTMGQVHHLTLPDRRTLAYERFGDSTGRPVFYCHGFPGSRLEAHLAAGAAKALGICLIAPDRPGFGGSTAAPRRLIHDWPDDLLILAEHLRLTRFHLVGVSGGGPYAIACADQLGARLDGAAIVCGLGALTPATDIGDMAPVAAQSIRLFRQLPLAGQWVYGRLVGPVLARYPELVFRIISGHAPPADRETLAQKPVRNALLASFREAFRDGGDGPARELWRYTNPWATDLTGIDVPVSLWHGEDDTTVPVTMGRRHAELIPRCRGHFLPGEGHFSLMVRYMPAILAELIAL